MSLYGRVGVRERALRFIYIRARAQMPRSNPFLLSTLRRLSIFSLLFRESLR